MPQKRRGELTAGDARHATERDDRDADGAVGRRHGIRDEADARCEQRRDAEAREHAGGDGDSGAEARHTLEEAAEAPADEQDEHALIRAHRGEHLLDGVHALRMEAEIISEDGGDDDEQDRPAGECRALERSLCRVDQRHAVNAETGCPGNEESDRTRLPG